MKYKLEDLIDINGIKDIFLRLNEFTDIPLSILDINGNHLIVTSQQDICCSFHKSHPISKNDCLESDSTILSRYNKKFGYAIYTCPRGLTECAIPIIIENNHLANVFLGQFFTEEPDMDFFIKQATQFEYDEVRYLEAVRKVPIISRDQLDKKIEFIKSFVYFLIDLGLKKLNEIKLSKKIERAEKELSKSEQYRLITENSSDMITLIDHNNVIIYISPSCNKIGGYKQSQIINNSMLYFIHPDDITEFELIHKEMISRRRESYSMVFRFLKNDFTYIWVESKMNAIYDEKTGNLIEIQSSTRDISLQKRMNEELIAAKNEADQANSAKSEFLANMSHEIRTPLNAVIGFSELLAATNLDSKQKSYVEAVNTAGKSLLMLINDILDLSKIEAGRMEVDFSPVSVKNIFIEIGQIFAQKFRSKNLELIMNLDKTIPQALLLDETRLRQVLLNLMGNAVKFTDKGSITLELKADYLDSDKSRLNLKISVIDTGIGIPENDHQRIFESFKQQSGQSNRKYGGTGLGLTITKKLVEMMNGKISLSSIYGKGSTFTIELFDIDVAASDSLPSQSILSDNNSLEFKKATVLVVDDVEFNRTLLKEILTKKGLDVITAENGYESLVIAEEIQPNVILMDIRMPVMDGYEASTKLKASEKTKHIPVIALTASTLGTKNTQKEELAFDGFLLKPVSTAKLFEELKKYLEIKGSTDKELLVDNNIVQEQTTTVSNELINLVENEILTIIKKLRVVLKISGVKTLSNILLETSKKYNLASLLDLANELKISTENFDVEIIKSNVEKANAYLELLIKKEGS